MRAAQTDIAQITLFAMLTRAGAIPSNVTSPTRLRKALQNALNGRSQQFVSKCKPWLAGHSRCRILSYDYVS
jgi:hypothetical protein